MKSRDYFKYIIHDCSKHITVNDKDSVWINEKLK